MRRAGLALLVVLTAAAALWFLGGGGPDEPGPAAPAREKDFVRTPQPAAAAPVEPARDGVRKEVDAGLAIEVRMPNGAPAYGARVFSRPAGAEGTEGSWLVHGFYRQGELRLPAFERDVVLTAAAPEGLSAEQPVAARETGRVVLELAGEADPDVAVVKGRVDLAGAGPGRWRVRLLRHHSLLRRPNGTVEYADSIEALDWPAGGQWVPLRQRALGPEGRFWFPLAWNSLWNEDRWRVEVLWSDPATDAVNAIQIPCTHSSSFPLDAGVHYEVPLLRPQAPLAITASLAGSTPDPEHSWKWRIELQAAKDSAPRGWAALDPSAATAELQLRLPPELRGFLVRAGVEFQWLEAWTPLHTLGPGTTALGTIRFPEPAALEVLVLDSRTGFPVAEHAVSLERVGMAFAPPGRLQAPSYRTALTDLQGRVRFPELGPGHYRIAAALVPGTVVSPGSAAPRIWEDTLLAAGQMLSITLQVNQAVIPIEARIDGAEPEETWLVSWRQPGTQARGKVAAGQGRFVLEVIPVAPVEFQAQSTWRGGIPHRTVRTAFGRWNPEQAAGEAMVLEVLPTLLRIPASPSSIRAEIFAHGDSGPQLEQGPLVAFSIMGVAEDIEVHGLPPGRYTLVLNSLPNGDYDIQIVEVR